VCAELGLLLSVAAVGVCPGIILELLDQKARGFLVPVALTPWFLDSTHKVFGEILMRT
jgi:hypothetical protein